ncbi:histidine phosphatase family protein [Lewinella sp. IMCC34183]|uniref:histidine phosphatase family protein n=1 Tax=Lewinella sp. IMCC34183 TaxID=2248762 RepID=UPI000E27D4AC|nr:histidine phosphatase family protein [Lewinella sp. IMCC34183]
MTEITFIRHGSTDWNLEQRAQGHTDIPLNATGRLQAQALAERLRGERWDYLYSSGLSRARETAEIIAAVLGLSVRTDGRLIEMSCGDCEGTTPAERVQRWGKDWKSLSLGVESREAIVERGRSFLSDVLDRHGGAKVLVVSHGALLGLTLRHLLPDIHTVGGLRNTSITRLIFREGRRECALYNCAEHIK